MKRANSILLAIVIVIQITLLSGCSPKKVEDKDFTLTYAGVTYTGKYTGEYVKKMPNGQGSFVGKFGSDEIEYSGSWTDGEISGTGSLRTTHYKMDFPDGESRTGEYQGSVLDGVPLGDGVFKSQNSHGISYTYTGEFLNGLANGQGATVYDTEDKDKHAGTYTNGDFTPTILEGVQVFGMDAKTGFSVRDNSKDFISKNEKLFSGESISTGELDAVTDAKLTYEEYAKRPAKYGDLLVHWKNYTVFQIQSYDFFKTDKEVTAINAEDKSGNVCTLFFIDEDSSTGSLPIKEGTSISFYALPLDHSTYENVNGGSTWSVVCLGAYLTYKN